MYKNQKEEVYFSGNNNIGNIKASLLFRLGISLGH
jgi:hypothetical protein